MGSVKYYKVNGKDVEFESYLVNINKSRAESVRKALKAMYGNQIKIKIVKTPKIGRGIRPGVKGIEYDLYTNPDERYFHKLKKKI
jgi:hypothetical protein